jgi:hypothetical protein
VRGLTICLVLLCLPVRSQTLIVGILGGWQKSDAPQRGVRKLALGMRDLHLPGVEIETYANHHREAALDKVKQWHAGAGPSSRIIVYGQSFGGAGAMKLDRELDALGIPVALSLHIDSVGANDRLIPANVAAAVNFYEREGFPIRGQSLIVAADPNRTKILGNFEYQYRHKNKDIDESAEKWSRRMFFGTHLKMEDDPAVWGEVEKYILQYVGAN